MLRTCSVCRMTYPADLFERFYDRCLGCMNEPVDHPAPIPARTEPAEWQELNTIAKIHAMFGRKPLVP